jgi:DNA repair protein SbcD/Mre11
MADPIRVLHFADVHIGMENYGKIDPNSGVSSRVVDFLHRLDDMIDYARENDVDLIIFAGDAFKTRSPNQTYQREFAHRIRDLSEIAPTVLLVGNHDLPINVLKASTIEIYETLDVPNVWVAQDYEAKRIETKRGDVVVGAAPYPIRARIMADINTRGMTVAQQDTELQKILHQLLEDLAVQADDLSDDNTPRILTGHFTVAGAIWGSERSVMLGRDVQVDLSSLADPRWDYVALGHIHKHQNLTRGREGVPAIVYSGSIERIDFGEEGDTKGFCWVNLERGTTEWEFMTVDARPMVTLRVDCKTASNPTQKVLDHMKRHLLRDAVVRLIIQLTPETDNLLKEGSIFDALKRAGVFHVAGIRKEVERHDRSRLDVSPEGLTPLELVDIYFKSRDTGGARREELLEKAKAIIEPE